MTAKERQKMQRLEIENQMLRELHSKDVGILGRVMTENIEMKATMELIKSAMGET
jgi:hypothetical protein